MNRGEPVVDRSLSKDLYDVDAEFYDMLYSDFTKDVDFIRQVAKTTGGPLLELMAGTGRVLLPLAREGHEIWGLDIHEGMMGKLKEKLAREPKEVRSRVHLEEQDARGFRVDRKFRLIFVAINSFLHLLTVEDQEACLRTVAEHLEPEGRFLAGLFHPDLRRPEDVIKLKKVIPLEDGSQLMWFETQTFDLQAQTTTFHMIYDFVAPTGEVRRQVAKGKLRLIFRQEMEATLRRCGLEVVELFGAYDGRRFDPDSTMQIYLCRRADSKP